MKREFTELEKVRRDKVEEMNSNGIKAWSKARKFQDNSKSLAENYADNDKEYYHDNRVETSSAGGIMGRRGPFIILKDSQGSFQVYITKGSNETMEDFASKLDIGDIIFVAGTVMKTNTGQVSIRAEEIQMLSKSLKPLPEKHHGLKDVEERYRRRYVDLIMSDETKEVFWTRSKIISGIRQYFDERGYLEADTPVLHPILGGAAATPFTTHHNALDMEFYLRIATELQLKMLLVGGYDKVYEVGRLFRNEGIDTTHNPEFTTIEFYEAHSDLEGMMKHVEELFRFLANKLGLQTLNYKEHTINLDQDFARLNMTDAVNEKTGKDFRNISFEEATEVAKSHGIKVESYWKIGHIINELFEELVEDTIVQPTFVYGHPIEISPLAAVNEEDPRFTDRAELFIVGKEYANLFTELNNPIDQLERFESQLAEKNAGNEEASEIDLMFIDALEHGMPPAGGCGIGIDRLVMLLTGKESIREVLLFPHLKNKPVNLKGDNNE